MPDQRECIRGRKTELAGRVLDHWERHERDDWRSIMPLSGHRAYDSTMINPVAGYILDQLALGHEIISVVDDLQQRYAEQPYARLLSDVRAAVMYLRELGVYEMTDEEIAEVYCTGMADVPGIHVMEETEIPEVADMLQRSLDEGSSQQILYSMQEAQPERFTPRVIRAQHLSSVECVFVYNNAQGNVSGVVSLFGAQPQSTVLMLGMIAVFEDEPTARFGAATNMLMAFEEYIRQLYSPAKLRIVARYYRSPSVDVGKSWLSDGSCAWSEELLSILAECGYRRDAYLEDEGGPRIDVAFYTKSLIVPVETA